MEKPEAHVILLSFPAQGHISPFLSLATRLHRYRPHNLTITLVSTPRHINSVRSSLSADSYLDLHSLPFRPADHGLPPGTEFTADIPVAQFITFFKATESLHPAFDDFISGLVSNASNRAQLCIVSDFFLGWSVDVARKYDVFHTTFLTMGAFGGAVFLSVWRNLPHTLTKSDRFSLPESPEVVIERSQLPKHILEADGTDQWSQYFKRHLISLHATDAIVVNTVEEFEPLGLGMLRKTFRVPIWPLGPPLPSADQPSLLIYDEEDATMTFLDSQPPASVLYISFGSQNSVQPEQMMQLAQGLEGSGCGFIWVIRPPIGTDPRGEFRDEWLPHGFRDRINRKQKGVLVHKWAPQLKILGHGSTGAFLSHCGWNSILESMCNGVPIICWPVGGEQLFNSKMLVESGFGVELARGVMDSSVPTKEDVEEVVEVVMGHNEKGMEIRRRAEECRELMSRAWSEDGGSSMNSLIEFVQWINTAAKKNEK